MCLPPPHHTGHSILVCLPMFCSKKVRTFGLDNSIFYKSLTNCFIYRCNYCDDKSSICISGEHTVQQCYANNSADIDSYPDSSLYQCKTCEKPLKLWPIERLKKSDCIKCRDDIDNDGHNLHICFPCQRDQVQVHHLCSFHNIDTNGLLTVDFSDTDSIPSKIKHKDTSCAQDV